MRTTRVFVLFAVLVMLLLIAAAAHGLSLLDSPPSVPHPTQGRENCLSCHNPDDHEGRGNGSCLGCHPGESAAAPSIPHPIAGRRDCVSCHGPGQTRPFPGNHEGRGNGSCLGCHPEGATTAPSVPHPIAGRRDCLSCHGPGQTRPFPVNHEGRGNDSCLGCHAAGSAEAPGVPHPIQGQENCLGCHDTGKIRPFPADHQGRGNASCTTCHSGSASGGSAIPHPVGGRENCLACHGLGQVRPFPADHEGRGPATCTVCHPAGAAAGPVIPHPTIGREDCIQCHASGKMKPFPADHQGRTNDRCALCHDLGAITAIPLVTHPLKGREDCLKCHAAGQMKPFPADHKGKPKETCTVCHDLGATAAIPLVPHPLKGREDCLKCHVAGQVKALPADHKGRTKETCTVCHDVGATGLIPAVPHPTEGREDCLLCHGPGKVKPFPADHKGRTKGTCLVCHQANAAAAAAIPSIPHPTAGREDCLTCHATGKVKPVPANHAGRTDETCTACHQASATAAAAIPAIPHPTEGREDCLVCHAAGKIKPFPANHGGRTKETCTACHQVSATAATPIPTIPHLTAGREDCLACHGPGQVKPFPADHQGRTKEMCTACHQVSATAAMATAAVIPPIPHTTEGREDCLVCHGPGQLKPFPADHEGRTKETCLTCHQVAQPTAAPTPSVGAVPTPIHEPELFGENTCVSCHQGLGSERAQITADWMESVHSAQGVGCVSCHGGDPTQADAGAAMSPQAGFLGALSKGQIPGLCGSCHSRVELMRPFDLPTDQLDQYWQSQHGQALLTGDGNVATCFDCHGGHRVFKVQDPASSVYPANEPAMCARCHADAALMQSYGFPTDQYGLYQKSVHGQAVLQKQDLRAPTCSTCHGKHGAAPPGVTQVANVCGQCHALTQEDYMKGAHRTGMTGAASPGCPTCHGQHDVAPPTLDLFLGTEDRRCGSCHAPGSSTAGQVDAIYQALKGADDAYTHAESVIAQAGEKRLIVAQQEELLQKANTPLVEARALQHTVNVAEIQAKAKESVDLSQQAQASAEAALRDIGTRRVGMVVALAVILVTVAALVLIKRELDHDLEAKRARNRSST